MKISLDWLGDYIEWTEGDPQEIAKRVTASIAEVDEVEQQGTLLEHCCVGKVLSVEKHPNADRLSLCDVQTDKGTKRVVCGGTNLRQGRRVAFAHPGATVKWHGTDMMTLEPVKIRGEQSEGMICAAEELDLSAQFPDAIGTSIVDMGNGDDGIGTSLKDYLGLTDTVLHIDNHAITHRADLFSHIGFARECVAIGLGTWKKESTFSAPTFGTDKIPFDFSVKSPDLMPRYCACTLSVDSLGDTPDWMKKRLEATGWRSINLPIDITNYVMMEIGVPLHSFDADDIKGTVELRQAKKGEYITTLDGQERELSEGALVLSDSEGIFDLLGIMGGLRSSTKEDTKNIYLHSASLDPVSIRKAMIAMGHRTDAGTTYEKGVAPYTAEQGFYRALELFLELVPGANITSTLDSFGNNGSPKPISFNVQRATSLIGKEIDSKTITNIFESLGCTAEKESDTTLSVTPPLWRQKDLQGAHDLTEEVARIVGYDSIEPELPLAPMQLPKRDKAVHKLRDSLKEQGYYELIPLSLVGPTLLEKAGFDVSKCTKIDNALGEELSLLHPSLLPRLLEHAEENLRRVKSGTLQTFSIANVWSDGKEEQELCMLLSRKTKKEKDSPLVLEAKESLTQALQAAGYSVTFKPGKDGGASVYVDGTEIGTVSLLDAGVASAFGIAEAAVVCVRASTLFAEAVHTTVFKPLPEYPAVQYDETLVLTKSFADVQQSAEKESDLLESVHVADMYKDNVTLTFTYRSNERTLTEEEVKKEHEKVMQAI